MRIISVLFLLQLYCLDIANSMTIKDVIDSAMQNNLDIASAGYELEAVKIKKNSSYASFLPEISLQSQFSADSLIDATRAKKQNAHSLVVGYSILNGGSGIATIKSANSALNAANMQYLNAVGNIILNAIDKYEEVIVTREIYDISISNEKLASANLLKVESRFKFGDVTITDVKRAKYELSRAVTAKNKAFGDVKTAESNFAYYIGISAPSKNIQDINLFAVDKFSSFENFMSSVMQNNPAIFASNFNAEAAKFAVGIARSKFFPSMSIQLQKSLQSGYPYNNQYLEGKESRATIALNVPIFSRGQDALGVKESVNSMNKAMNDAENMTQKVKNKAIEYWNQMSVARSNLESIQNGLHLAESALSSAQAEYEVGTKTTIELLRAQQDLHEIRVESAKVRRNLVMAIFASYYLSGNIHNIDYSKL